MATPQTSPATVVTSELAELGPEEKRAGGSTQAAAEADEPYTIYGHKERWALVAVVAVAGLFS